MRGLIQEYIDRGWYLTPLAPGTKRPIEKGWPETATNDLATIERWLDRDRPLNLAVVCAPSALVVLDVDTKNEQPGLVTLAHRRADLPATLTASTPSGGRHLFYARPFGVPVRNTRLRQLPGCELWTSPGLAESRCLLFFVGVERRFEGGGADVAQARMPPARVIEAFDVLPNGVGSLPA